MANEPYNVTSEWLQKLRQQPPLLRYELFTVPEDGRALWVVTQPAGMSNREFGYHLMALVGVVAGELEAIGIDPVEMQQTMAAIQSGARSGRIAREEGGS